MCSLPQTRQVCIAGTCTQIACEDGYADCSFGAAGCETDVRSDAAHCGRCGSACAGTCTSGVCMARGPIAHFDARIGSSITTNIGAVVSWADLTANHHDLLALEGNAVPVPAAIGTGNAINFFAATLRTAAFPTPVEMTVAIVLRYQSTGAWGSIAHHGSRDTDWSIENDGLMGTASGPTQFQSAGENNACLIHLTIGEAYVLVARVHADRSRDFLAESPSGRDVASAGTSSISGNSGQLYVGGSDIAEHSNAVIGEIVYFDRAISDAERDDLVRSMRTSWVF